MLHAGLTIPPKKKETIPARRASSFWLYIGLDSGEGRNAWEL
jgi:hypothetical protein